MLPIPAKLRVLAACFHGVCCICRELSFYIAKLREQWAFSRNIVLAQLTSLVRISIKAVYLSNRFLQDRVAVGSNFVPGGAQGGTEVSASVI